MQLGQNPAVVSALDRFDRRSFQLKIGRWIGVFIEFGIFETVPDDVTILGGQLVFGKMRVRLNSFTKRGFNFLESDHGRRDQTGTG